MKNKKIKQILRPLTFAFVFGIFGVIAISISHADTPNNAISILPSSGTDAPIVLGNNNIIELQGSIVIQPAKLQLDVQNVEYFIDNRMLATVQTPPYTQSLDTTTLTNGLHELMVKITATSGQIVTNNEQLAINNSVSHTQTNLLNLLIALFLVAIGAFVIWRRLRRKDSNTNFV